MTSTAITRRLADVSGITSSRGASGSGRRGQTRIVHRICNSIFNMTAGCNSSIVIPDEEDIGPTGDIRSPIKTCACDIVTRKRALRDGEGSAAWDGAVKVDGSTWRYVSQWMRTVRLHRLGNID
jgi:hypothetical protein